MEGTSDGQLNVQVGSSFDPNGLNMASNALKKFAADSLSYGSSIRKGVDVTNGAFDALAKNLLVINGNAQVFGKTLQTDIATLNAYKSAINDLLAKGVRPTSKEITTLASQVDILNKRIASASSPFSKLKVGSEQAGNAMMNLGRVVQDAPFGFIGIQNNLNPLLESFARLKAETGSSGAALKALASSMVGPAGLGFALSIVSSLYLVYTEYSRKAAKADEEKAKNTKSAKDALNDYINSLSASIRAQVIGTANAQKDIIVLRQLYDASTNVNIPMEERRRAAQKLIDQYPKTFENFSAEQIALGKASVAYRTLAVDIIAVAKASARTDILVENEKEIVQLGQKQKLLEKQLQTQREIDEREKATAKTTSVSGGNILGTTNSNEDFIRATNQVSKTVALQQQLKETGNQIAIKRRESLGIEKEITDEIVKQQRVVSITGIDGGDKEKEKKLKSLAEILAELNIELIKNENQLGKTFSEKRKDDIGSYQKALDDLIENGIKPASEAYRKLAEQQQRMVQLEAPMQSPSAVVKSDDKSDNSIKPVLKIDGLIKEVSDLDVFIAQLEEGLNKMGEFPNILNTIGDALGSSFEAMGEAIANGGNVLASAGKALQSAVGGIMVSLGQQFITLGAAKVAAGILATPFGGKLISQGTGLIALGAALSLAGGVVKNLGGSDSSSSSTSGSKSNVKQFADGGIVYGNTLAQVGEYPGARSNPEVIAPLNKLKDIIGNRGATTVNLTGGVSLGARELVLFLESEKNLMKRSGYSFT